MLNLSKRSIPLLPFCVLQFLKRTFVEFDDTEEWRDCLAVLLVVAFSSVLSWLVGSLPSCPLATSVPHS